MKIPNIKATTAALSLLASTLFLDKAVQLRFSNDVVDICKGSLINKGLSSDQLVKLENEINMDIAGKPKLNVFDLMVNSKLNTKRIVKWQFSADTTGKGGMFNGTAWFPGPTKTVSAELKSDFVDLLKSIKNRIKRI